MTGFDEIRARLVADAIAGCQAAAKKARRG